MTSDRLTMYPALPARESWLDVEAGHRLYVETCGNEAGVPVVVLHGGPGGGIHPQMRRYFNPGFWRVVLFDQRGAGQSRPFATLADNHTDALLDDMEVLRQSLGIERWWLFGGSWGSTLALLYAQRYPQHCMGLILRGVFLCRQRDLAWLYGPDGAARLYPKAWGAFVKGLPGDSPETVLGFYREQLAKPDAQALPWARQWAAWEARLSTLLPNSSIADSFDKTALALARIENHYFCYQGFIRESQILEEAEQMADLPGYIAHGRHDLVCPLEQAMLLQQHWPSAYLNVVEGTGHSATEPAMEQALLEAVVRAEEVTS